MNNFVRLLAIFLTVNACLAAITINISGNCANIRASPGLTGAVVACLNSGVRLETNGVTKPADGMNWVQVNHAGNWRWVAAQFTTTATNAVTPTGNPSETDYSKYPTSFTANGYTYSGKRSQVLHLLKAKFGLSASTYQSHSDGPTSSADLWCPGAIYAVDNSGMSCMNQLADYLAANLDKLGLKYVIWKQRIWGNWAKFWKQMENRGSIVQNHFDHVHITFV